MTPVTSEFVFGIPALLAGAWMGGIGFGVIRPPINRRGGAVAEKQYLFAWGPMFKRSGLTLIIGGSFMVLHGIWRLVNLTG
jgi:hypothetical protein